LLCQGHSILGNPPISIGSVPRASRVSSAIFLANQTQLRQVTLVTPASVCALCVRLCSPSPCNGSERTTDLEFPRPLDALGTATGSPSTRPPHDVNNLISTYLCRFGPPLGESSPTLAGDSERQGTPCIPSCPVPPSGCARARACAALTLTRPTQLTRPASCARPTKRPMCGLHCPRGTAYDAQPTRLHVLRYDPRMAYAATRPTIRPTYGVRGFRGLYSLYSLHGLHAQHSPRGSRHLWYDRGTACLACTAYTAMFDIWYSLCHIQI
jgi:hypothetical protein